jgi:cytoskeletal protein CcmA (bactofilin family)
MVRRVALVGLLLAVLAALPASAAGSPRNQVVISGSLDVPAGRTVGDVVIVDGPVNVAGRVKGDLVAVHGVVRVNGFVDGSITAVSKRVILGPRARVDGNLHYGDEKPRIAPGATITGKVTHDDWSGVARPHFGFLAYFLLWLAISLSTLALGVLVWWLAPRVMEAANEAARRRTGVVVAWAFGIFLGLPILAVLALVTLVGIPLGLGLLLALLPLSAVGYVTTSWIVGRSLLPRRRDWFLVGFAGFGILRLIALVPFLGVVIWFAAGAVGLAALVVAGWRARGADTGSGPQPVPAGASPPG